LYKHASGALVFATGSVQWSWGLDTDHDGDATPSDLRMQQATVNLFADMGLQPGSRQDTLVAADASTDIYPPTSTITAPASGVVATSGVPVTVTGTASDLNPVVTGAIGGVEVSVDGGATWHPASGRESWTYTWTPTVSGPTTIRSRAVDDSANLESPAAGVSATVNA